ncbi:MAG: glycine cleavage system protein GcvH [Phycisphaeraceae bacterium]|nr:glycine cleavage system protein GcvH [Phycisphaeraceae bacterium]
MASPIDRSYTKTHEWIKVEGDIATLGLTRHAVDQLTDVTFVEMKKPGTVFAAGSAIGEVESVKTTSDVYAPVAGAILEINSSAVSDPSLLNSDPFGAGWLLKIKISDPAGLSACVDGPTYDAEFAH